MKVTKSYSYPIKDDEFIEHLEKLYEILNNEYLLILKDDNIKIEYFSETDFHPKLKNNFWKRIAELTNKRYLSWKLNNKAKYFRCVAEEVRRNYSSLKDKIEVSKICSKYEWKNNEDLRDELHSLNLYPTNATINNICRAKKIFTEQEAGAFTLDFASQDKQTITREIDKPSYTINFNKEWLNIEVPIPNFVRKRNITKFCLPKFKKVYSTWYIIIPYEFESEDYLYEKNIIAGIDLGKVKTYSLGIIKSKNIIEREYIPSKRIEAISRKMNRIYFNLHHVRKKLDWFNELYKYNKDKELNSKRARLMLEKLLLSEKISRLKLQRARLIGDEVRIIVKKHKIKEIHLERLNWVETTGGKWEFSVIQKAIENAVLDIGIKNKKRLLKVNAYHTSKQNPFSEEKETGITNNRDIIFKDFRIDRDRLADYNIAARNIDNIDLTLNFSNVIYANSQRIR